MATSITTAAAAASQDKVAYWVVEKDEYDIHPWVVSCKRLFQIACWNLNNGVTASCLLFTWHYAACQPRQNHSFQYVQTELLDHRRLALGRASVLEALLFAACFASNICSCNTLVLPCCLIPMIRPTLVDVLNYHHESLFLTAECHGGMQVVQCWLPSVTRAVLGHSIVEQCL